MQEPQNVLTVGVTGTSSGSDLEDNIASKFSTVTFEYMDTDKSLDQSEVTVANPPVLFTELIDTADIWSSIYSCVFNNGNPKSVLETAT